MAVRPSVLLSDGRTQQTCATHIHSTCSPFERQLATHPREKMVAFTVSSVHLNNWLPP